MAKFTVTETGKVEFFGLTTATPDFLEKHGITSAQKLDSDDLLVQTRPDGTTTWYVYEGIEQKLRLVSLAGHLPAIPSPAALEETFASHAGTRLGELLYRGHFDDVDTRAGLIDVTYDAAISAGVTHATARWFACYFVEDAFLGLGMDQEFTERGVFRGPDAFSSSPETVKKQLTQLQRAGLLRFEAVAKQGGFYVQFNRLSFPGVPLEKLPDFFSSLLY